LHDIDSLDFRKILTRRYFNRVWIIQELILAPSVVFHVAGVDFWTDRSGLSRLETAPATWNWDTTGAPWLQHIAQKAFPTSDLYDILRLTSKSRASDPRDRVFGILGLIQPDHEGAARPFDTPPRPDYSLSAQQVFIGLFAHLIINGKVDRLLQHAVGVPESGSFPSWVPDWTSQQSWESIFSTTRPSGPYDSMNNPDAINVLPIHQNDSERPQISLRGVRWALSRHMAESTISSGPWDRSVQVNPRTGALSIWLHHLCDISLPPQSIWKAGIGNRSLDVF